LIAQHVLKHESQGFDELSPYWCNS
jgi:hypothetical protein